MADNVLAKLCDGATQYLRSQMMSRVLSMWECGKESTESPIEAYLHTGLELCLEIHEKTHPFAVYPIFDSSPDAATELLTSPELRASFIGPDLDRIVVMTQQKIGKYRADFVVAILTRQSHADFCVIAGRPLVVECDGAAFHDANETQVNRDRERDRDMETAGFSILRFSGKEIHRDPYGCAHQVVFWLALRRAEQIGAWESASKAGASA